MNLGEVIISITVLGYLSNTLNWRYLNYEIIRILYYVGAFVHESSHALLCIVTGARIEEFGIFSRQPHVTHEKSKLPLVGELLISFAPIAGGLLFLFLVNRFLLGNYFTIPPFASWHDALAGPLKFLAQINLLRWQSWVMILLSFNMGAMLGPSARDLKNIWPLLVILLFIRSDFFSRMGLLAAVLILMNIAIQIIAIAVLKIIKVIFR